MALKNKIKIGIADDHKLFRTAMKSILTEDIIITVEAENGNDLIKKLSSSSSIPELLIIDINMPEMNGIDTTQWVKNNYPNIKILILTMHSAEEIVFKALKAGADGYLTKNSSQEEMINAIKSIIEKGYYYNDFITSSLINLIRNNSIIEKEKNNSEILNIWETLILKEKQILKRMIDGFTDSEISESMNLTRKAVEYSKYKILEKFKVKNRTELISLIVKNLPNL